MPPSSATLALVIFAIGLLTLTFTQFCGHKYLFNVMKSNSMRPAINRGDLVLAWPLSTGEGIAEGDIVLIQVPGLDPVLVCHRVTEVARSSSGGSTIHYFMTKGDANLRDDSWMVDHRMRGRRRMFEVSEVVVKAKVVLILPKVGWPVILVRESVSKVSSQVRQKRRPLTFKRVDLCWVINHPTSARSALGSLRSAPWPWHGDRSCPRFTIGGWAERSP